MSHLKTITTWSLAIFVGLAVMNLSLVEVNAQKGGLSEGGGGGGADKIKKSKPKFMEPLDSKDLSSFEGYQNSKIGDCWKIEGKHLVCDGKDGGDIITKEEYGDFELQVEWKIEEGGNSGIMFHVTKGDDQPYMSGPEIQILDDEKHADGKDGKTSAGALYGLYEANGKKLKEAGKWNKSRLVVEGSKITNYLNNDKVFEVDTESEEYKKRLADSKFKDWEKFGKSEKGHICFQNHGDPVRFRNLRLKRLDEMEDQVNPGMQLRDTALGAPNESMAAPPGAGGPGRRKK